MMRPARLACLAAFLLAVPATAAPVVDEAYGAYQAGHYRRAQAEALKRVPLVVTQELFASPATARAKYVLPAATWAEKDGTLVNHAGLAQAIHWAVSPPRETRTDGQVYLDLMERRGLVHAPGLRKELGTQVPYFGPLKSQDLGEHGIRLEG